MAQLPLSKIRNVDGTYYLSGELGFGPDGSLPDGIEAQTRQTLHNIEATLATVGLDLGDVFSATCYLTDRSDFAGFNEAYRSLLSDPMPVRTTICTELVIDALVEITVIARKS